MGPERRDLVKGESVTLADGKVINPEDVLGELKDHVEWKVQMQRFLKKRSQTI
ncbi:hypothetical protein ACFLXB_02585 [Chloroflexota bacterium]